eukprot:1536073-Prymnesium_polylepis.1
MRATGIAGVPRVGTPGRLYASGPPGAATVVRRLRRSCGVLPSTQLLTSALLSLHEHLMM